MIEASDHGGAVLRHPSCHSGPSNYKLFPVRHQYNSRQGDQLKSENEKNPTGCEKKFRFARCLSKEWDGVNGKMGIL